MGLITVDYRDRKLIYEQIVDNVKGLILRGDLKRDEFLPSVRSLAREIGINPNTIQKAYTELERQGIIKTLPGRGSMIVFDKASMEENGMDELRAAFAPLVARARVLHIDAVRFAQIAEKSFLSFSKDTSGIDGGDIHD